MNKKLPGVFVNQIDKELTNNKSVFYSQNEGLDRMDMDHFENVTSGQSNFFFPNGNVEQKIQDIFRSVNYIYKADVVITTAQGKVEKRIIGKNNGNLITMENELIPISSILDIVLK